MTDGGAEILEVRMLEVPLRLRERSRQHGADLLREMELISLGHSSGVTNRELPTRLLQLAQELERVYGPNVSGAVDEMDAALDRGEEVLAEVVYRLPRASLGMIEHITRILDEADEFCRAGRDLLTLAPPPEIDVYRRWATREVMRQSDGLPPTPWPHFAAEHGLIAG